MDATNSPAMQGRRNALIPVVLLLGIGAMVCSFAISCYWGMALAVSALLMAQFGLKDVSRSVWSWCVAFATTGFAIGLAALLMRVFVDFYSR